MKRLILLLMMVLVGIPTIAQELNGTQLLDKAITYHDPNDLWNLFQGKLFITMSTPDEKERHSEIELNLPKSYFKLTSTKDDVRIEQTLQGSSCTLKLNGNADISEEDKKTHRISCDRALVMKNYYTYLYGLPMKLKDPGTHIHPKVSTKSFKGKTYLVLKVTYDETVGNDTWYFYFDPTTYAMEVYQFFHDESKNDGEYIVLTGIENVASIKMPKTRAWYYNKDNGYLGTDELTKATGL